MVWLTVRTPARRLRRPARTLEIMKDPRSGPVAVVVLVIMLLLVQRPTGGAAGAAALRAGPGAPARARGAAGAVSLHLYVRPNGLGRALAANLPRSRALIVLAMVVIGCLLLGATGLLALTLAGVTFLLARRAMLRRLGGATGDTAGALLELVECAVLVGLALQFSPRPSRDGRARGMLGHQLDDPVDEHPQLGADMAIWRKRRYSGIASSCQSSSNGTSSPLARCVFTM